MTAIAGVFKVEICTDRANKGQRLLYVRCPHCITKIRGTKKRPAHMVPSVHVHGGGLDGTPLESYLGSRAPHCFEDDKHVINVHGGYDLKLAPDCVTVQGVHDE